MVGESGLPGWLVVLLVVVLVLTLVPVLMLLMPAAEVVGVAVVSEVADMDRRKPRSASFWGVSSLGNLFPWGVVMQCCYVLR